MILYLQCFTVSGENRGENYEDVQISRSGILARSAALVSILDMYLDQFELWDMSHSYPIRVPSNR